MCAAKDRVSAQCASGEAWAPATRTAAIPTGSAPLTFPSLRPPRRGIKQAMSGDRSGSGAYGAAVAVVLGAPLLLAGCGGKENILHPHSHAEHRISVVWWVTMIGAWIGFGVVVLGLFLGWWRRNRPNLPFGGGERAATLLVIGLGVGVPIVVLSLLVFAQPRAQYEAWLRKEAKPAAASTLTGARVFLSHACSGCHQIRGTGARGLVGPDLTHLMSRTTLAAGTIANTRDDLANWIIDPQHFKPGNKTPALNISGPDLDALLAYLRSLK